MRVIYCLLLVSVCNMCQAQDDMPDFRSKRDNLLKIQEKDVQSDVSTFTMTGLDINMGKLPLRTLSISDFGDDFLKFDSGNIKIAITSAPFNAAKHKMQYVEKYLTRIDSKPYYGSYSKIPKKSIQSVSVLIDNDTIAIPPTAYSDLYEPNFTYTQGGARKSYDGVFFSANNHYMYIYMLCNDGMGGYEVTWVIQDKKYLRRVLDFNVLKN
jgi:hypothetical protein